jgi:hypothetical protein
VWKTIAGDCPRFRTEPLIALTDGAPLEIARIPLISRTPGATLPKPKPADGDSVNSDEAKALELLAGLVQDGCIVEIGSFAGRSAICLSKAGRTVYTIDPAPQPTLEANLKAAGASNVVVIKKTSEDAAAGFHEPIGLIFIDGDHRYEFVSQDFYLWEPKVLPGGFMAFHDFSCVLSDGEWQITEDIDKWAGNAPNGPTKCIIKDVLTSGIFDAFGQKESLVFFRKRKDVE